MMLPSGQCHSLTVQLHQTEAYRFKGDVEQAVGAAIKGMGPDTVLALLPLQLDSDEPQQEFPRSWLLPLLAKNITGANVSVQEQ
jgi:ribosomal RNA-processing protein 12